MALAKSKMARRAFLVLLLLAVPALFLAHRLLTHDPEAIVATILRRRLGRLKLDPEGVERFARLFVQRMPHMQHAWNWRAFYVLLPIYAATDLIRAKQLYALETDVVGKYLMASDYFRGGGSPVRFVRDPWERICSNPFARFEHD